MRLAARAAVRETDERSDHFPDVSADSRAVGEAEVRQLPRAPATGGETLDMFKFLNGAVERGLLHVSSR
jgi:hypothetical protein